MNIIQPKILDSLGLLPKIINVNMTKGVDTLVNINFEIDIPNKSNKNPWIFEQNILSLLDLNIIFCFNKDLKNYLLENNEKIYTEFNINPFVRGYDFVQKISKIQPSKLSFVKKETQSRSEFLSTGFMEFIKTQKKDVDDFSIFISISMDKVEISKRFNINLEKIKTTIGTFICESFIQDSRYINSKLNDITIFKQKDKFKFNSLFLDSIQNESISVKSKKDSLYFSELFHAFDKNNMLNAYFYVNIDKILKEKSSFPIFFDNKLFIKNFYSNKNNYYPFNIVLKRYNNTTEELLYEGPLLDEIVSNNISFQNILFENGRFLLFFKDLDSKNLFQKYKYMIELYFEDNTMKYIDSLKRRILNLDNKISQIYNIANNKDYYVLALNYFKNEFYNELTRNKLSIENSIIELTNILSEFRFIEDNILTSIKNLSNSKYINFEILDCIIDIIGFLKSEITRLENYSKDKLFSNIVIKSSFDDKYIQFGDDITFSEDMIELDDNNYPSISNKNYIERIKSEVSKYYNISEITNNSKYKYLSPYKLNGKYSNIVQNHKFSELDFNSYNDLFVDYFVHKLYKGNFSNLKRQEKIIMILDHYGINIDRFIINTNAKENLLAKDPGKGLVKDFRTNFDENILFNVFIRCLMIKDRSLFNFDSLNKDSGKSKLSKITNKDVPIQTDSLIKTYNKNTISVTTKDEFEDYLSDNSMFFAIYSNYKNLYKVQYYNIENNNWEDINETIVLSKFGKLLCRCISFIDNDLNINKSDTIDFKTINDVFILEWKEKISEITFEPIIEPKVQQIQKLTISEKRTKESEIKQEVNIIKPTRQQVVSVDQKNNTITSKSVDDKTNTVTTRTLQKQEPIITKKVDDKTKIIEKQTVQTEVEKITVEKRTLEKTPVANTVTRTITTKVVEKEEPIKQNQTRTVQQDKISQTKTVQQDKTSQTKQVTKIDKLSQSDVNSILKNGKLSK